MNRQVKARTRRLIAAAGESSYTPTFLPEAVYEDCSRPMETKQALLAELLLLIPVFNVAAAIYFAVNPSVNRNLRSISRAFLILVGIVLTVFGGFLAGKLM